MVNTSASPPRTTGEPEGDLQQGSLHAVRQGHDAKHRIKAREAFEQRLSRLREVATDTQKQPRSRALGTGWKVHAAACRRTRRSCEGSLNCMASGTLRRHMTSDFF
jgi:hypothetical protein